MSKKSRTEEYNRHIKLTFFANVLDNDRKYAILIANHTHILENGGPTTSKTQK